MEEKISFLKPIISDNQELSTEKMSKINFLFKPLEFSIGQHIIKEGDKFKGFYLIEKGDIELKRNRV